ncbi:MAG: hypothetical protein J5879_02760 [Clostridia bacterium]|nr:hypothetical protein [Clostridia bacterium]
MAFYIKIASEVFRIEPLYGYIYEYCKGYYTDPADDAYDVSADAADIDFEREHMDVLVPDKMLEALAVYRKISEYLPAHGSFLFHGSAAAIDGKAYVFTAKSGVGKSTHAKLLRQTYKDRVVMINDDKPIITYRDGVAYASGTPWNGKHRLSTNITVPIKAICFLSRGEQNHIERISPSDAFVGLLSQTYRPFSKDALKYTLQLLSGVSESVDFYRLACNMDPEAAEVSYNGMK